MDGAAALPAWVQPADASQSSIRVQLDDRMLWFSHVCQTPDCRGNQVFLFTDPAAHAMQDLLLEASGSEGAAARKRIWLGKPDAAVQDWLKGQVPRG